MTHLVKVYEAGLDVVFDFSGFIVDKTTIQLIDDCVYIEFDDSNPVNHAEYLASLIKPLCRFGFCYFTVAVRRSGTTSSCNCALRDKKENKWEFDKYGNLPFQAALFELLEA
jgi:hypothetical protein